ncbi:unnamed protein product [Eruca vesicaria subsp. sativa]|uniref:Cystatin domain-containing protein n=1 Tax=Eruca vesicaria subsp. sativa TaxID=29727 RepID=A0ABC8M7X9_ERUVS|nr:unnamed protein product [Eruca vesicaria subsp. sativa]
MATKSSDGEKKEIDTEPMETSTGAESSLLGKRKLEETHDQEDSGEEEEEEEDSDSCWEKDSFDGREYHPSDDSEYSDEILQEKARYYNRTVIETKGFFESSNKLPLYMWGGITVVSHRDLEKKMYGGITGREFIGNMACECVEKHNRRNNKNVKFERVLRANFDPGAKTKYYITFAARESDSPDAPLVEYQAKVVWSAGITYPIFCRPAPPQG